MFDVKRLINKFLSWDPYVDEPVTMNQPAKQYYSNESHWKAIDSDTHSIEGMPIDAYKRHMEELWLSNIQPTDSDAAATHDTHASEEVRAAKMAADKLLARAKVRAIRGSASIDTSRNAEKHRRSA